MDMVAPLLCMFVLVFILSLAISGDCLLLKKTIAFALSARESMLIFLSFSMFG